MTDSIETSIEQVGQQAIQLYEQGRYEQAIGAFTQLCDLLRQYYGEKHPYFAASLINLADLYRDMGNYFAAEPLYKQALGITREAVGEHHPDYAQSLNNLALTYHSMGNYLAAESSFRQILEIRREALGEHHPDYAQSLNNLAGVYQSMGNYLAAEPLYKEALGIAREALGEDHPDYATCLNNLAWNNYMMGNYLAAEPLYKQARDIYGEALGEHHPAYAQCLNNLAGLYQAMGNYLAAEPLYKQARDITRETLGDEHPAYAQCLNNLAELYRETGDYLAAEPLYKQALDIYGEALGQNHRDYAQTLNNLARLYKAMGNYAAAEPLYKQALNIRREALGEHHPDYAQSLNNLTAMYQSMGNYAAAEPLYKQVVDITREALGEHHPDYANSLHNLAGLYDTMGNYLTAGPLYEQALDIYGEALGKAHPAYARTLNNLAGLYQSMGNYAVAEPLYKQAVDIKRETFGLEHPDYAFSLSNLAELYQSMGNYLAAEPLYKQARDIWREVLGEKHPDYARNLNNLAILYSATARENEALEMLEQAAAIDDGMIGQVFSIGSESQRAAYLASIHGNFDAFLSLVLQHFAQSPEVVRSALDLVLRRKAIEAEALAAQRDIVLGGRHPLLEPKLRRLATNRAQIAQKMIAGPKLGESLQAHQQSLAELTAQLEQLEAELARQIPEMNLEQNLHAADRQGVARKLPKGAALVEFVRFNVRDFKAVPARREQQWKPAHYVAFVMPTGEPDNVQMVDLGEVESLDDVDRTVPPAIDNLISSFRASVTKKAGRGVKVGEDGSGRHGGVEEDQDEIMTGSQAGVALHAALFAPLVPLLGKHKKLFLSPDGDLSRLPFEILPSADGHLLIDDYEISYLSVGRDVLRFGRPSTGQPGPPLVAADPDFDLKGSSDSTEPGSNRTPARESVDLGRSGLSFGRLAGTLEEGKQVARMLKVEPLLGGDVLEERLEKTRSPQILHIATHGFFLADQKPDPNRQQGIKGSIVPGDSAMERLVVAGRENPLLRSGLALAGANQWLEGKPLPEEAGDGIMNAVDVSGLDLLDTELVVLSACETGLGQVKLGEGVYGLRRAFVLAGAKTLVMSLWKVPDKQTQELMQEFYRRLLAGQPRTIALREAQLVMKERYPDPYYWGAFICQGDPGPLSGGIAGEPSPERATSR